MMGPYIRKGVFETIGRGEERLSTSKVEEKDRIMVIFIATVKP